MKSRALLCLAQTTNVTYMSAQTTFLSTSNSSSLAVVTAILLNWGWTGVEEGIGRGTSRPSKEETGESFRRRNNVHSACECVFLNSW